MPSSSALQRALSKGLVFAVPLLALTLWLELGLRQMPNAMSRKRAGFEAVAPRAELLVLGASEGYQGLSPDLLGIPGYNLANVGQDLFYDRALFEKFLPRLPRLKTVILALSYPSLEYRLPFSPESWRQFQYSQVWGLAPESPAARWDLRRFSALLLIEAWPALLAAKDGFRGEAAAPGAGPDGWQALEALAQEQRDLRLNSLTAGKRARYHDGLLDPQRDAEGQALLEALAQAVDHAGARLCIVTLPVTRDYAKAVDAVRIARLRAAAAKTAAAHGGRYWDLFEDRRFDDSDFADPDHLDRRGAAKVAAILKPQLH
jgi:hypothetical protein